MIPIYWKKFVENHNLIGQEIEFPWPGESDLNAIIEILDYNAIKMEATEYWPGIGALKHGYIPVGGCAIGTGDPFFININDGEDGPLYKIDHEETTDITKGIYVMLQSYKSLIEWHNK
jgi:hypothetical protein